MAASRKVLIADDDSSVRDLVRTYLDMEGCEVHMAKPFTRPQLLARMARMIHMPAPQRASANI